jgi:hypothetical protein
MTLNVTKLQLIDSVDVYTIVDVHHTPFLRPHLQNGIPLLNYGRSKPTRGQQSNG